ncbi:MAG TPA: glycosyltransferase family 1 protein [Acidimicrobiales bacterium]|nr:glycosyltransferase family 1 protein [Acidimicrobiales bacterium]
MAGAAGGTSAGAGPVSAARDTGDGGVLLVVEQLRRAVPGGIGTYARGLLQGLATLAGGDGALPPVTLLASRPPATPDPLAAFGLPVMASALPGPLLTRAWDRGLLRTPGRFAVVHALSLAVPPTGKSAEVVTVHDLAWRAVPDAYPRRGRRWHDKALGRALRRASHFVVPSAAVAGDLVSAGAPSGAVTVVPHGSDHLPAPDHAAAGALLERLGVGGEFLLSVGTLEPRKNLTRLFDAYADARGALPGPWPLVVVGPTGWGARTPSRDGIVFAGPVGDGTLASLYERARLLAYVPLQEGFGLPPLEAMRAGTPVVASPLPSTGDAALEVDPARVDEIAGAIVRLATDDALRARHAAAGRAHAARLTWSAAAGAHVAVWASLA